MILRGEENQCIYPLPLLEVVEMYVVVNRSNIKGTKCSRLLVVFDHSKDQRGSDLSILIFVVGLKENAHKTNCIGKRPLEQLYFTFI